MSTICWVAIFDMILSLIDPLGSGKDTAYADDLATLSPDPETQQDKADRISAFCLFSGMAIAFPKVEAVCIQHPHHINEPPTTLTLRSVEWSPVPVPIDIPKSTRHTRYLGAKVAYGPADRTSHKWCVAHLRGSLEVLHTRRASTECRRKVIEMQLLPQVLYHAAHASWTLKAYQSLDSILAAAIRRLHRLPRSYPTDLLYLPKSDLGLGYTRISDAAQTQKWGILQRSIALGGQPAETSHELIRRAMANDDMVLYVSSLLEWGKLHDLSLTDIAPGPPPRSYPSAQSLMESLALSDPSHLEENPVGSIFTDGSYRPTGLTPMSLLAHPSRAYNQGTGGIGIIWLPPADRIGIDPARVLQILPSETYLPHMTANTMELYAQVAASRLSTHVPSVIPTFSDCKSVVHSINEATSITRRPMGHTAKGIFYESIASSERLVRRKLQWTRSHPERRIPDRTKWSYNDLGIFLADAVAEGKWDVVEELLGTN